MENFGNIAAGETVAYTTSFTVTKDETCKIRASAICDGENIEVCENQDFVVSQNNGGECSAGLGRFYGQSTQMYTLANMKNWTNNFLAIKFKNQDHTRIDSIQVHTTSRTPSYYNGNGGTFKLHLHADNNGVPGVRLGSTPDYIGATSLTSTTGPWSSQAQAQATYPNAIWNSYGETGKHNEYHRRYNLASPITVEPCEVYHIVMERTSSTAHGTSLNGLFSDTIPKWDEPCILEDDWTIKNSQNGTSWSNLPHRGIFAVYGNGTTIGNATHEIAAFSDADRSNNVNGSSAARQCWKPHKTMDISRLRVQAARRTGSAPLFFEIKQGTTVVRSGSITGFPVITTTDIRQTNSQSARKAVDFPKLTVQAGQQYYIELKTTAGTHYEVGMVRDGVLSGYYNLDPDYHGWGAGNRSEVSYNNGGSWVLPTNWGGQRNYLQLSADVVECHDGVSSCLEDMCLCS